MKWVFLIPLFLLTDQTAGTSSALLQRHQVWMTQNIHWVKMPVDYHPKLNWGGATVLYFGPNRKFGMIECVLNKQRRSLTISHGDGQNIYIGEWVEQDGGAIRRKPSERVRACRRAVAERGPLAGGARIAAGQTACADAWLVCQAARDGTGVRHAKMQFTHSDLFELSSRQVPSDAPG
jgi:hypothetical protein